MKSEVLSLSIASAVVSATPMLVAAPFPVIQIAETGDEYSQFDPPAIRGNAVVFAGTSSSTHIYRVDLSSPQQRPEILVDVSELRPDGLGEGKRLHPHTPWLDGEDLAFSASFPDEARALDVTVICARIDGVLHLCADRSVQYPGELSGLQKKPPRKVMYFYPGPARGVVLEDGAVYFRCYNDLLSGRKRWGVYRWREGRIEAVVDGQATYHHPIDTLKSPTGGQNLRQITDFAHHRGRTWVKSWAGFYRSDQAGNRELAFDATGRIAKTDSGFILGVVGGKLVARIEGWMHVLEDGKASPLIGWEAVVPLKKGRKPSLTEKDNFSAFDNAAAFVERGSGMVREGNGGAIHVTMNGKVVRIVGRDEEVNGLTLEAFRIGPQGFDGNRLAFLASYGSGESRRTGVFVAQVRPPSQ